jgi:hypothetical protein
MNVEAWEVQMGYSWRDAYGSQKTCLNIRTDTCLLLGIRQLLRLLKTWTLDKRTEDHSRGEHQTNQTQRYGTISPAVVNSNAGSAVKRHVPPLWKAQKSHVATGREISQLVRLAENGSHDALLMHQDSHVFSADSMAQPASSLAFP